MPRIELNGEGEPVWLTPHLRDPQPEGEREIIIYHTSKETEIMQTLNCQMGSHDSHFIKLACGVRQGGVLSPYFFSIFVDDIVNKITECNFGCHIRNICRPTVHPFFVC